MLPLYKPQPSNLVQEWKTWQNKWVDSIGKSIVLLPLENFKKEKEKQINVNPLEN